MRRFSTSIFSPLCLYGLRPSELGWLFYEQIDNQWLRVNCLAELDYATKGRRDKRFPLVSCVRALWQVTNRPTGLVYHKRRLTADQHSVAVTDMSLADLADEYQRRRAKTGAESALRRRRVRTSLMKQAGQLNYDHVQGEFSRLAQRLDWPRGATLKDLRHLFNMCLENAGVPLFFRKYFMGQSFGNAPIVSYTHLTAEKVQEQYHKALRTELAGIHDALVQRAKALSLIE